jgi:hypothetical protein
MIAKVCATSTLQNIALRVQQVLCLSFQNMHVHHLRDRSTTFANFGQSIFAKWSLKGPAITQLRPPPPKRNAQDLAGYLAAIIVSDTSPKHQHQDLPHLHLH